MSDHKAEEIKGKVKETVGDITGDKGLQIEGKLDQAVASAKKQIDKLEDSLDSHDASDQEATDSKA